MGLLEIVVVALGLAMDAFAVSVTLGLSVERPRPAEFILPGLFFGFFQFLMPLIGYFGGIRFAAHIGELDHWIALGLLGFIGGNMIKGSLSKEPAEPGEAGEAAEAAVPGEPAVSPEAGAGGFGFMRLLGLAVATSIDALAVGISFAVLGAPIYRAALITGGVTFFIALGGVIIGARGGRRFRAKAEGIGGAVLIAIGIKIAIEHIFFS